MWDAAGMNYPCFFFVQPRALHGGLAGVNARRRRIARYDHSCDFELVVANCAVITSAVDWLESCEPALPLANEVTPPFIHHNDPDTDGKKAILERLFSQSTYTCPKFGIVISRTPEEEEVA